MAVTRAQAIESTKQYRAVTHWFDHVSHYMQLLVGTPEGFAAAEEFIKARARRDLPPIQFEQEH